MTVAQTYTILGMACGHCETFVAEELRQLAGVESVSVDVDGDSVTVISRHSLESARVADAVSRAGYELIVTDQ